MKANVGRLAQLNIHAFFTFLYFICLLQQVSSRGWRMTDNGDYCNRVNNGHLKISSTNSYNL